MQRSRLASLLVGAAAASLGCQKSEAGKTLPSATARASGPTPSCSLLTKAEVEGILHEAMQEPSEATLPGVCEFVPAGDRVPRLSVKFYPNQPRSVFESETKRGAEVLKVTREPITGFGEEAFLIGNFELAVYAHGKAFELGYVIRPIEPAQRDALAKIALSRW